LKRYYDLSSSGESESDADAESDASNEGEDKKQVIYYLGLFKYVCIVFY
jgi:hypothetical protein